MLLKPVSVAVLVQSEPNGPIYTVTLHANGEASCECPGWFHRNSCKHITEARNMLGSFNPETGTVFDRTKTNRALMSASVDVTSENPWS